MFVEVQVIRFHRKCVCFNGCKSHSARVGLGCTGGARASAAAVRPLRAKRALRPAFRGPLPLSVLNAKRLDQLLLLSIFQTCVGKMEQGRDFKDKVLLIKPYK